VPEATLPPLLRVIDSPHGVYPLSRESGWRASGNRCVSRLFWLNPDLKLIWVNRAWEELTGHPAEAVIGLVCHDHGPTRAGDLSGLGGSFLPPPPRSGPAGRREDRP